MSSYIKKSKLIAVVQILVVLSMFWGSKDVITAENLSRTPNIQSSDILVSDTPDSVTATHITNRSAPHIDGILEDIWQNAGKLQLPNSAGNCFTIEEQNYPTTDPSTFTVFFLHDSHKLYIAIQTTDRMIEGSDYDQNADGLQGMAIVRKNDLDNPFSMFRLMWHQDESPVLTGPPIDRDRMTFDAEWRSSINGTWNDNSDSDTGYVFEFSFPLKDPVNSSKFGLGGWEAGEHIRTNIVLVDHDSFPGAPYNDPAVDFRKCWWGADKAEDLSKDRTIYLSDEVPVGEPGDDKVVKARHINTFAAPVIDGVPNESIWGQGGCLRFPNSVGDSWTLGQARYNADDPGVYDMCFLHDGKYLYVSLVATDGRIEAAGPSQHDDQASDGLTSFVLEMKGGGADKRYSTFWGSALLVWNRVIQINPP